jgi:hypothetical protein
MAGEREVRGSVACGSGGVVHCVSSAAVAHSRSWQVKRKEIYTYEAPWMIYGMNWSVRDAELSEYKFRLALGSFIEEYNNKVEVSKLFQQPSVCRSRSLSGVGALVDHSAG